MSIKTLFQQDLKKILTKKNTYEKVMNTKFQIGTTCEYHLKYQIPYGSQMIKIINFTRNLFEQPVHIKFNVQLSARGVHHAFFRIGRLNSSRSSMKVSAVFPRKVTTYSMSKVAQLDTVQLSSTALFFVPYPVGPLSIWRW